MQGLQFKLRTARGVTVFHLFLASKAVSGPWNDLEALDFDRIFAHGADTVVIVVNPPNGIFNGTQLIELSAFEHKGDFAVAGATGDV